MTLDQLREANGLVARYYRIQDRQDATQEVHAVIALQEQLDKLEWELAGLGVTIK